MYKIVITLRTKGNYTTGKIRKRLLKPKSKEKVIGSYLFDKIKYEFKKLNDSLSFYEKKGR